MMSFPV